MAAGDEQDLIEAVVTCEGNLHDPDFQDRFRTLVDNLKTALYISKTKDPFRVRKIEPWNSVRVTISIPKEAAQKLKLLAQQGSNVLRSMGILSVQVEGDQVISLTWAAQNNETTQVILRQTSDEPAGSSGTSGVSSSSLPASSPSISSISSSVASISSPIPLTPGPSGESSGMAVTLDMLSSTSSSTLAFRSPNVVAPTGEAIPALPPKATATVVRPALGGPFPFVSMTHAAQAIQRSEMSPLTSSNNIVVSNNSGSNAANSTNSIVSSVPSSPSLNQGPIKSLTSPQSNLPVTVSNNSSSGAPVIVSTSTCNVVTAINVNSEPQVTRLIIDNSPGSNSATQVGGNNVASLGISGSNNIALSHAGPSQSLQLQLVNVPPPYPGVNTISSNHSISSSSSHHSSNLTSNVQSRNQQATLRSIAGVSPHPSHQTQLPAATTSADPSASSPSSISRTGSGEVPSSTPSTNISDSTSGVSPSAQPVSSPLLVNLLQNNDVIPGSSSTSNTETFNQQQKLQQKNPSVPAQSGVNDNVHAKPLQHQHNQQMKKTKRGFSLDGASKTPGGGGALLGADADLASSVSSQKSSMAESFQFALPLPSDGSSSVTMNRVSVPPNPSESRKLTASVPQQTTSETSSTVVIQGRTIRLIDQGSGQLRTIPIQQQPPPPPYPSGSVSSVQGKSPTETSPAHTLLGKGPGQLTLPNGPIHTPVVLQSTDGGDFSETRSDKTSNLATVTLVHPKEQQKPSDRDASGTVSTALSAADQSRTLLPITTVNIVTKSPTKTSSNVNSNSNKASDSKTFIPPPDPRPSSQVQKLPHNSNSVSAKHSAASNLVVQTTGYNSDAKSSTSQLHHLGRTAMINKRLSKERAFLPGQITSPGKPRQFLINPLTGHLEPMPSECGSEIEEGDDSNADSDAGRKFNSHKSSLSKNKIGKPSSLPPGFHHRQIVTTETGVTVARVVKASAVDSNIAQSLNELDVKKLTGSSQGKASSLTLSDSSTSSVMSVSKKPREDSTTAALHAPKDSKDNNPSPATVTATSVTGEKIKLRLKLEKSEPISPAYKVDVSFVKKSEKSSVLPTTNTGSGSTSSISATLPSVSSSQGSSGDQPRVPPLHISLRGKNAAVVVSPRREEKDMPPPLSFGGNTKEALVHNKDPNTLERENPPPMLSSHSKAMPQLMNSHDVKSSSGKSSSSAKRVKNRLKSFDGHIGKPSGGGSEKVKTKMSRPKLSKEVSSRPGPTGHDGKDTVHLTMPVLQPAVVLPAPPEAVIREHGTKLNILTTKDVKSEAPITAISKIDSTSGETRVHQEKSPTTTPSTKPPSKANSEPVLSDGVDAYDLKDGESGQLSHKAKTEVRVPDNTVLPIVSVKIEEPPTITQTVSVSKESLLPEKAPVVNTDITSTHSKSNLSSKPAMEEQPTSPSLTGKGQLPNVDDKSKGAFSLSDIPLKEESSKEKLPPPQISGNTSTNPDTPEVEASKKDESVVSPVIALSTVSCDINNRSSTECQQENVEKGNVSGFDSLKQQPPVLTLPGMESGTGATRTTTAVAEIPQLMPTAAVEEKVSSKKSDVNSSEVPASCAKRLQEESKDISLGGTEKTISSESCADVGRESENIILTTPAEIVKPNELEFNEEKTDESVYCSPVANTENTANAEQDSGEPLKSEILPNEPVIVTSLKLEEDGPTEPEATKEVELTTEKEEKIEPNLSPNEPANVRQNNGGVKRKRSSDVTISEPEDSRAVKCTKLTMEGDKGLTTAVVKEVTPEDATSERVTKQETENKISSHINLTNTNELEEKEKALHEKTEQSREENEMHSVEDTENQIDLVLEKNPDVKVPVESSKSMSIQLTHQEDKTLELIKEKESKDVISEKAITPQQEDTVVVANTSGNEEHEAVMHPNIDKESTSAIKSNLTSDELGIELTTEVKKVEIVESSEVCTSKKMEMVCEKEGQQQDAVRANEEQLIPESLDEKIIPNNDKLIDPLEESPTAQCIVNELVSSKSLESEPLKRESKEELVKENHELKVMATEELKSSEQEPVVPPTEPDVVLPKSDLIHKIAGPNASKPLESLKKEIILPSDDIPKPNDPIATKKDSGKAKSSDISQAEKIKKEALKVECLKPEVSKSDEMKKEPLKVECPKPENAKEEPLKVECPKPEKVKEEPLKVECPKPETVQAEPFKVECPKPEISKLKQGEKKVEAEKPKIVKSKEAVKDKLVVAPQLVSVTSSVSKSVAATDEVVSPVTVVEKVEAMIDGESVSNKVDRDVNITIMTPKNAETPNVSATSNPPISIVLPSDSLLRSSNPEGKGTSKNAYKRRAEIKPGALQNTLKRLHDNFLPKVLKTSEMQDALTQSSKTASVGDPDSDAEQQGKAGESSIASPSNSAVPSATQTKPIAQPSVSQSVSIAMPQMRPVPNVLQRPKLSTTVTAATPKLHQISTTLQPNLIANVSTASGNVCISTAALSSVASLSVTTSSSGGQPQTVFAIHPNVSIPANFAQLQQSPMVLPGGHKMVPIKLVTLPKQSSGQLQTIPLGSGTPNRSSPNLLEAVNIVANAGSRSSSPKTTLIGSTGQPTPLNLSSMSLPVGGNLHFVPISVSSATGTTGNVKVLMTQPIKMQQAGLSQSMVVKSVLMGNQPTTIRVIRPGSLPEPISLQSLIRPTHGQGLVNKPVNPKSDIPKTDSSVKKSEFTIQSDSLFKKLDGVEIVDTGSPLNNDELPFEADIIHDEKDLADVLAAEAKNDTIPSENCINFHTTEVKAVVTATEKQKPKPKPALVSVSCIPNHVASKKLVSVSRVEASTSVSPAPVMRVASPHFTYSSSSKASREPAPTARSPSPLGPDLHGEDEEIINSFSLSPSQPRLSPQNKPHSFDSNDIKASRSDHTYGMRAAGEMTNCDNSNSLGQELSIEIPPIDMEVALSPSQNPPEGKRCTRSTRSNPRLSPDITAFVSETSKPNKLAAKVDLMALRSSPKPSPTGSLKVLSPTPSSLTITPSTSTRSSPILHNQHQINANNAAATINAVAMGIIDKIQGNATAQNLKNSRISKLAGTNKRKRQESDSSSASRDENIEDKTEIDLNSRPGKRKCSENAAEMIKVCIGVEDSPKRNSSTLIKKTEETKTKDGKGKKTMTPLLEEDDDADSEVSLPRGRSGRSSRESSEDRSSSRGSSAQRMVATITEKTKSVKEKDEEAPKETKSGRINNRAKEVTTKAKNLQPDKSSPHQNATPGKKTKDAATGKGTPRRVSRPTSKTKSPLTPAKTRTNVRKDVVPAQASSEKNSTQVSSTSATPDNENARRKTRSSAAGKRHVT